MTDDELRDRITVALYIADGALIDAVMPVVREAIADELDDTADELERLLRWRVNRARRRAARWRQALHDREPNDGPGPDGHHVITGECFACMVGVATGPESHGDRCSQRTLLWRQP